MEKWDFIGWTVDEQGRKEGRLTQGFPLPGERWGGGRTLLRLGPGEVWAACNQGLPLAGLGLIGQD